jgi:hypothetical protein
MVTETARACHVNDVSMTGPNVLDNSFLSFFQIHEGHINKQERWVRDHVQAKQQHSHTSWYTKSAADWTVSKQGQRRRVRKGGEMEAGTQKNKRKSPSRYNKENS